MQRLKKALIGLTVNQPCNALAVIPRYVKQSKVEHFGLIVMDGGRRIIDYRVLYKGRDYFRILLPDLCVSERSAVPEFLRAKKADSHPEKMHIIKTTVPYRIICAKKRLPFADLLP